MTTGLKVSPQDVDNVIVMTHSHRAPGAPKESKSDIVSRLRRLVRSVLIVSAAAMSIPIASASAVTAPSGASFLANFESPLTTNFQLLSQLGAALPVRVTSPVRLGSYAASMTVRPGQERSELQANQAGATLKIRPGSTEWFADSMYLAPGFPTRVPTSMNGFQTVLQWKGLGGTQSVSPPVSVDIRNGEYTLYGGWGCPTGPRTYRLNLAPATTGTWTDFMFQIHFDTTGRGWVSAWVNNHQVIANYFPPCGTAYAAPYSAWQAIRIGYYRDPQISTPGTIVHDEYRMGATQASVSLYG